MERGWKENRTQLLLAVNWLLAFDGNGHWTAKPLLFWGKAWSFLGARTFQGGITPANILNDNLTLADIFESFPSVDGFSVLTRRKHLR
jgi:hypothetical protein